MLTGATLMNRVEETGIVILTQDGIDTRQQGWEMMWSFKLVHASQEIRGTSSRVVRGMQGQLERGHMIAQAAFGYKLERVYPDDARKAGTSWIIDPVNAQIVRDMYSWRFGGMSVALIARRLNEAGIPSPRCSKKKQKSYWRPASVHRVLTNTVYRGLFQWNGSSFSKAKAKRKRRELEIVDYQRPQLRLVDDDVWYACNPLPGERSVRGGGKHVFAGLLECTECRSTLSVGGGPKSFSLHCPTCDQAVRVGAKAAFLGYTSVAAARQALLHALRLLFTGPVIQEFRNRLKARLHDKPAEEEAQLRAQLAEIEVSRERLLRMMRNASIDEAMLTGEFAKLSEEFKRAQGRLGQVEKRRSKVTQPVIDAQCAVDPLPFLELMLDGQPQNYKVRATLRRLVRRFVFVAKPAKYHAVFEIDFVAGVLLAEMSETATVDEQLVKFRVDVRTTASRPVQWVVQVTRQD
jgi:site-specific DNA recombinase